MKRAGHPARFLFCARRWLGDNHEFQ